MVAGNVAIGGGAPTRNDIAAIGGLNNGTCPVNITAAETMLPLDRRNLRTQQKGTK